MRNKFCYARVSEHNRIEIDIESATSQKCALMRICSCELGRKLPCAHTRALIPKKL